MNDDFEFWNVERYVDLGNEAFWHEVARIWRHDWQTDEYLTATGHTIAARLPSGTRWRIRVVTETTVFDSEGGTNG